MPSIKVSVYIALLGLLCGLPADVDVLAQTGDATREEARLNAELVDLFKKKKFEDAFKVGTQLLALREKLFGANHVIVAYSLSDLGEIQSASHRNDDAEKSYVRAVAILEQQPKADPRLLSHSLERIAHINAVKGDYLKAARLLERALATRRAGTSDELAIAVTQHALANIYHVLRRFTEAEPLYVQSLTTMERAKGRDHPDTVASMKDYACLDYQASEPRVVNVDPTTDKQRQEKKPHSEILARARCWLLGFKSNCVTEEYRDYSQENVLNGRALALPKPRYPANARAIGAEGRVIVAVLIDQKGKVAAAKAICGGPPSLHGPAVSAARGAKFSPTVVNGQPIEVTGIIHYNFIRW